MIRSDSNRGRSIQTLLSAVAALCVVALAAHFSIGGLAALKMRNVRSAWERSLGSWDEILKRYPAHEANAAALSIEQLTLDLGVELAPRSRSRSRNAGERDRVAAFKRHKRELGAFLNRQLERSQRGVETPPAGVERYLQEHQGVFQALRQELLAGPQPRWEADLGKLHAAPVPNLIGHIDLQKAMLSNALAALAGGDRQAALENLEASWTLNQSLRDRPELITQLMAISVARMQAGALRHIANVPVSWVQRLDGAAFRSTFQTALDLEASLWTRIDLADLSNSEPESGWTKFLATRLMGPYVRYSAADVSERFREQLRNLEGVEALCDYDLAAWNADLEPGVPGWNVLGELYAPGVGDALLRLGRLEHDLELSARLIELDAARANSDGRWPASISAEQQRSAACPDDRWRYSVDSQGTMTLAFSRKISWDDQRGAILPTSFRVGS